MNARKVLFLFSAVVVIAACADPLLLPKDPEPDSGHVNQFRVVRSDSHDPSCTIQVDIARELMVRAIPVVEDPTRTTWNGSLADPKAGAWHFGRLMTQLAGPAQNPSDFTREWLSKWESPQLVNGINVPARTNIGPLVIGPWPKLPDGRLDLTRAPMRLLAIVNRMDLKNLASGNAGEGRFVFGVLDGAGNQTQFTVIFEYRLPAANQAELDQWANRWHALSTFPIGSPDYNNALQDVTDRFTGTIGAPSLSQLRTNEIALTSPWELREFRIDANAKLAQVTVAQTANLPLNQSPPLADWINQNQAAILAGTHQVPLQFNGQPFRAGAAETPFGIFWNSPGIISPDARFLFSVNTCNGCHAGETNTTFLHVGPRNPGFEAPLSGFLTGITVNDPVNGTPRTFNDLAARRDAFVDLLCAAKSTKTAVISPANGSTVGGFVPVEVSASGQNVGRVDFLVDNNPIFGWTSPPFTFTWDSRSVPDGSHVLSSRVFDGPTVVDSAPVTVQVANNVNGPPSVSISSPVAGALVSGTNVQIAATASDPQGIQRVDFFVDGIFLNPDQTAPFETRWNSRTVPNGSHTLIARAFDNTGLAADSAPVGVTVDNDITPPSVALSAPANGATVRGTVTVSANASDDRGVVSRVEFFDGPNFLGTDTSAPFSINWTGSEGTHTLTARAFDPAGNSSASSGISVTVDNTPPLVSMTEPTAGATASGSAVVVAANATDNGIVSRVEFRDGTKLLGSDPTAPFNITWDTTLAANGAHTLTATAFDLAGNSSISAGRSVTVSNTGNAVFDAGRRAPVCATTGAVCNTANLVDGRANLGPELNQPNTIAGTCADGTSGTYHSDESLDRLRVSSTDGTAITAGKQVRIEATVWTFSTSGNKLDLFHAPDANAPAWTLIGTLTPTVGQKSTLSTTFTLPAGGLQAIRGSFRFNGTAVSCPTSGFDDKDDVVFAVVSSTPTPTPTPTPAPVLAASFDAVRRAPTCVGAGSGCDSGVLLNGRATLGPEPNQPNTLAATCADGGAGSFHSDESLDKLRIVTVDGSPLAAGKQVRIEATVWTFSTSSNRLDLWHAPNASSPVWSLIGTLAPTVGQASTLSTTFTLPSGGVQAIRGSFRFSTGVVPCPTGGFDDKDDLVFEAQSPNPI